MAAEGKVIIFHRCNLIFLFSQQRWKTMGSQPNLTSRSEVVSIYKCPPPQKKKKIGGFSLNVGRKNIKVGYYYIFIIMIIIIIIVVVVVFTITIATTTTVLLLLLLLLMGNWTRVKEIGQLSKWCENLRKCRLSELYRATAARWVFPTHAWWQFPSEQSSLFQTYNSPATTHT